MEKFMNSVVEMIKKISYIPPMKWSHHIFVRWKKVGAVYMNVMQSDHSCTSSCRVLTEYEMEYIEIVIDCYQAIPLVSSVPMKIFHLA
jgi:hypothetical protein